jgi:hypothetical protein
MKWLNQGLFAIYGITALYFLYLAGITMFVYFANKSMGHQESFLVPGRNLALGLFLGLFAFVGWKILQNPGLHKIVTFLYYLPVGMIIIYVLWFALLYFSSGGNWQ